MNKKKVSVIITTYKRSPEIVERAIKSVDNQTYKNIELIVINDYPEDSKNVKNIEYVLRKYKQLKSKYIVVEKNGGACKARNIGIKEANGDYIAFLDDDDEWLEDKLFEQLKCFDINKKCGVVYCNFIIHNDDKRIDDVFYKNKQPSGNIHDQLLCKNIIGSCSFPLFKKEVLVDSNGFREDMPAMQDWELYLRISKKYNFKYIDKPLAIYHKYKGERISKNYEKRVIAHKKIEEEYGDEIKKNKNALYSFYIGECNVYSANNQQKEAFMPLIKAIALKPFEIRNNIKTIIKYIISFFIEGNRL